MVELKAPSPDDLVLKAYFGGRVAKRHLSHAFQHLGIEDGDESEFTRLHAAVASVALRKVRRRLPQWAVIRDGSVTLGRKANGRSSRSRFNPKHLFTLNWADTGPGFSWPMAYYATTISPHKRVVITASADCPDTFGFCDVALGHFPVEKDALGGAKSVIIDHWTHLAGYDQERWACLFEEGLISEAGANQWADEVWPSEEE